MYFNYWFTSLLILQASLREGQVAPAAWVEGSHQQAGEDKVWQVGWTPIVHWAFNDSYGFRS